MKANIVVVASSVQPIAAVATPWPVVLTSHPVKKETLGSYIVYHASSRDQFRHDGLEFGYLEHPEYGTKE